MCRNEHIPIGMLIDKIIPGIVIAVIVPDCAQWTSHFSR